MAACDHFCLKTLRFKLLNKVGDQLHQNPLKVVYLCVFSLIYGLMFENLIVSNYDSMNLVGGEGDRDGEGVVKALLSPLKTFNSLTACQRICFEAIGRRINTIHKGKGSASKH